MSARPWDIRELHAGDARRLRTGHRVIHRVPTPRPPRWSDITADPDTRTLLAALADRGFEQSGIVDNLAYLALPVPGGYPVLAVVAVSWDDPQVVERVTVGRRTMTPAQAAAWLHGEEGRR